MPEIWLPYGDVEVSFDTKAEYLGSVFEAETQEIADEQIQDSLKQVEGSEQVLVIICDYDESVKRVLRPLLGTLKSKGEVAVTCHNRRMAATRRMCEETNCKLLSLGKASEPLGSFEGIEVAASKPLTSYAKKIVLSKAGFDSLFGFSGGPVSLMRTVFPDLLGEAFRRRSGDEPHPGYDLSTARFAGEVTKSLGEVPAVEVVTRRGKLTDISVGELRMAHENAIQKLSNVGKKVVDEPSKGLIVSPGGEADDTLGSSLRSVWNASKGAKEGASLVLMAECRGGLGSEALESYVVGRLDLQGLLRRGDYVDGMEDLIYLKNMVDRIQLIAVSTLPTYYLETRLGIKPLKKASEALKHVVTSHGHRVKVHFVPAGDSTILTEGLGPKV